MTGSGKRVVEGADRGQIIVLAALLIAVMFVGLAVVLNSAIYAENLASRDTGSTVDPVVQHNAAEQRMERVLAETNFGVEDATYAERHRIVRRNVSALRDRLGGQAALEGTASISRISATKNGTRLNQSQKGDFMPAKSTLLDEVSYLLTDFRIDPLGLGDKKNWLVSNGTAARGFEMTVDRGSLHEKDPGIPTELVETTNALLTGSRLFWVEIDQNSASDEYWRIYLLDDDANNSVEAAVVEFDDGSGTVRQRCSASGDEVTIRLSAGELVGDDGTVPCSAMRRATNGTSQDVYFAGADEVHGTYQMIVDEPETAFREDLEDRYGLFLEGVLDALVDLLLAPLGGSLDDDDIFHDEPTDGDPYTTTAIYSVSVEQVYVDDRVTYERNVTVAPESPATE